MTARSLGPLPITYQANVRGQTKDILNIDEDGKVTFLKPEQTDTRNLLEFVPYNLHARIKDRTTVTGIQRYMMEAWQAVSDEGGGGLEVPAGMIMLEGDGINAALLEDLSNVHMFGSGIGATTVKLAPSASGMLLNLKRATNCSLTSMTLDGNRENQSGSGHCFRGEDLDGFTMDLVELKNAYSYGGGLQDGFFKRICLSRLLIHGTGADGLDCKNKDSGEDSDANDFLFLNIVSVWNWGIRSDLTAQAAIDLRATWTSSHVRIKEPARNDCVGFRWRFGEADDGANGFGGHRSTLTDFVIDMGAATAGLGISVGGRNCSAGQGYIRGGQDGVSITDSGFKGSGITVEDVADDSFVCAALGGGLDADSAKFMGCESINAGGNDWNITADKVTLVACEGDGTTIINADADATKLIGYRGTVTDNGTNTSQI